MNTGAMRNLLKLLVPALLVAAVTAQAQPQPVQATEPLTPDQVAVYHAFLRQYLSESERVGLKGVLNIAKTTTPFKPDSSDIKKGGCLNNFKPINTKTGAHTFTNQFADIKDVRVVNASETAHHGISNPKANKTILREGLLTFSEVIFDPTHQYAAASYSFESPWNRDSGTDIFKLDHGTWKPSHKSFYCLQSVWAKAD